MALAKNTLSKDVLSDIDSEYLIKQIYEYYISNKHLFEHFSAMPKGYTEMSDINLSIAEEDTLSDISDYESYLLSLSPAFKKGASSLAKPKRYKQKPKLDQTR